MAYEAIKQWAIAYPNVTLRDTRNSIIAEQLFDDPKIWMFQDGTENNKWRSFKSLDKCVEAWEDVPGFARSNITVTPECEYLTSIRLGAALELSANIPLIKNIESFINVDKSQVSVHVKWSSEEDGVDYVSGHEVARTTYDKLDQIPFAMISALYLALIATKESKLLKSGRFFVNEFKLF